VMASIASGGGSVGGTTSVNTNGSGIATFSNLSISGTPGPRTLRFTATAAQATSNTVNVSYSAGSYTVTYCGTQLMDVTVPNAAFPRPRPVAVYIHGGGWTSGDRTLGLLLSEVRDELVNNRGYVVVSIDYRLAPTDQWPAQIHDAKCAIRHMRARAGDYGTDGHIGVWGASSGAHLAALIGTSGSGNLEGNEGFPGISSAVDAVAPIGHISDLSSASAQAELYFPDPPNVFPTWPGPSQELTDASPVSWASSNDPPFYIVHGTADATVDFNQAVRMDDALSFVGANVTLLPVVNGGHNLNDVGMGTPSHTLDQIKTIIADFFDAYVN